MKINKILSVSLVGGITIILSGCGGDNSNEISANIKTTKIKASDAYVVSLPSPAIITLSNGHVYSSQKIDRNGTIIFSIPKTESLKGAKVTIPDTAIVDTDGDGVLSSKDQQIRMELSLRIDETIPTNNIIANPITTVATLKNDKETLDKFKNFDPVKAKLELVENYNEKTAKLVAISDAIADTIKNAKEKKLQTKEIVNNINTDEIDKIVDNSSIDINTTLRSVLNDIDEKAIKKAVEIVEIAKETHQLVKEKKIAPHEAVIALIAVSDGNIDPSIAKESIKKRDIKNIVDKLPSHNIKTPPQENIEMPPTPPGFNEEKNNTITSHSSGTKNSDYSNIELPPMPPSMEDIKKDKEEHSPSKNDEFTDDFSSQKNNETNNSKPSNSTKKNNNDLSLPPMPPVPPAI